MDFKAIIETADADLQNANKTNAPLFSVSGLVTAAKCYKVYDADTCRIAMWFHGSLVSWKVRIQHFDSAEMRTKDPVEKELALIAKARTKDMVDEKVCCVSCYGFDKYGRLLVDIMSPEGLDVATTLLNEKLAYPYEGGTKITDWVALSREREMYLGALK